MTEEIFVKELEKIGIKATKKQLSDLKKYYDLLIDWNEKINLTAITEIKDVYLKHFYDSLTIIKIIDLTKNSTLCDIGSGAGFPGIVLKIFFPNLKITLIDSLNKRITFLKEVIKELHLENIEAIHQRIEDYGRNNRSKFDIVTARAVTKLPTLLEYAIPITKVNGYFIPLKGDVVLELDKTKNASEKLNCLLFDKIVFKLPIEDSVRTILKYQKIKETSNKYPRNNNVIKNMPL